MANRRRPVLFLIDVEPDGRITDESDPWAGTRTALPRLQRFRAEVEGRTGVTARFNWFLRLDPQIEKLWGRPDWVVHSLPELLEIMLRHRDHAGIHHHLWKWHPERQTWYNDFSDPVWIEHSLRFSRDAFEMRFGHAPVSCRFGDRWLSEDAVRLEAACGIRYDFTLEPGLPDFPLFDDPQATSWLPDFRSAPRLPYRPRPGCYLEPGADGPLWMIPLSTTAPRLRPIRRFPYLMRASYSPNLALSAAMLGRHFEHEFTRDTLEPFVFVLRTGDVASPRFGQNIEANLACLASQAGLDRCEFTGPEAAVVDA